MSNISNSKKPVHLPPPKLEPTMLVYEISKMFRDEMRRANEEAGIPSGYRNLLFHLAHEDGRTQLELSQLTHLKPPTVSITLQKMEQSGYVKRKTDENDMRITRVYLTEKGSAVNELNHKKVEELDKIIMKNITEEEKQTLLALLTKMRNNFTNTQVLGDEG